MSLATTMNHTFSNRAAKPLCTATLAAFCLSFELQAQVCATYRQLSAGNEFSVALRADGQITAWGYNGFGQTVVPALAPNVTYVEVAAGGSESTHVIARRSDGSLIGWGNNSSGQTNVPSVGAPFQKLAAGMSHSLALTSGGTVVAWGSNSHGQRTLPPSLVGVVCTDIAAGWYHSLALRSNGTVTGFGNNTVGECVLPPLASGLSYVEVAAGAYFSIGRVSDGSLRAAGTNNSGQCSVPTGNDYVQIAAGRHFAYARRSNGQVVGWGDNANAETTIPALPAGVVYTDVAAGGYHGIAARSDGQAVAFGYNSWGQCNVPVLPFCGCEGSLVLNGPFTIGLVPGSMPAASVANWISNTNTTQVVDTDGCAQLGCLQMWGNQVVGESVRQLLPVPIVAGRTYQLSVCYRWLGPGTALTSQVRFRISAGSTGGYPSTSGTDLVGMTPYTSSSAWATYATTWTAPRNAPYLYINPENEHAINDGSYVSWGRIDDLCLREAGRVEQLGAGCYGSNAPLLTAALLPSLNSSVDLVTTNLQSGTWLGLQVLSLASIPGGLELTGAGMPGCTLYVPLDVTPLWLASNGAGHYSLGIGSSTSLIGTHVYAQSLAFSPGFNSFGGLLSNAIDLLVGW